tara:strand:+ start:26 stop:646 length:621 start_codon:yes stop_codon:yes gene_type:complete
MAVVGQVVPEGQQSKEGFHGLRRTTEGYLYYTKIDKDSTNSVDFEQGSPTDKNGGVQLPTKSDYTESTTKFQSSVNTYTGDGSTVAFSLSTPVLDDTRIKVYVNMVEQEKNTIWSYASGTVTFNIAPFSGATISVPLIDKEYKNNTSDFYHQYTFEDGDATYFIDDNGYLVKRENRSRGATALTSDDFSTVESTYGVASTTWQSAV